MADIHLSNGNDTYVQPEADKNVWNNVFGEDGDDVIRLYQGVAVGGKGNDRFELIAVPGEPWRNLAVAYWSSPKGVVVNLEQGWADDGFGGRDTLIGVSQVHGSGNDDNFTGDAKDNFFFPNGGHDIIDGRGGYDGLQVREIPQSADGGGKWLPALMSQLDIAVSPDGLSAVISVKAYPKFRYELSNVEYFQLMADDTKYQLADFIEPQDMASQAIAAGGNLRWNAASPLGTAATLSYSFVTQAPASGVGAEGFRAFSASEQQAVRDLLASTAALCGLSFTELDESTGGVGQLRFGVSAQAATKGQSWLPNQAGAGNLAGDVWMDSDSMIGLAPGGEGTMALLHEIGHALGLRHPRNLDAGDAWPVQLREQDDRSALSVMSENLSADGLFRSEWGPLDVLALRYLYGARAVNAGDTVYRLGARESNAQTTLVDDGGQDSLDASALPTGVSLDLVPGHLSSAGLSTPGVVGVDNLAIAAGSWIENAIGSAFDDVLLGNELDNRLTGGPGNDWIDGGAGTDTATFEGQRSDYEVSNGFGKLYVKARDGSSGFDTLVNIERLQFADQTIVLSASALSADASYSLDEDASLSVTLDAPTDAGRSSVRYSLISAPAHGSATLSAQGELRYVPAADFYGQDSLVFEIAGSVGTNPGANRYEAYLKVLPINDGAPQGRDGDFLAQAGALMQSRLPAATDVDHDPLSYGLVSDPAKGVAVVAADGHFSYQAKAGFSGSDSFSYSVSDGMGGANTYTARLSVLAVNRLITGSAGPDTVLGEASGDGYSLLGGDDRITAGPGNDVIDGGEGLDTSIYLGPRSQYSIAYAQGHWSVSDSSRAEGIDQLVAVERLQFADRSVALDMDSPGGHGGQTAQILRALFGADMLKSPVYAGYGVVLLDRGMAFADLVALAIGTDAFLNLAHSHSNRDFVQLVYRNVVGSDAPAADLAYFTGLLDSGAYTQTSLGVLACQTELNTHSIEIAGLANAGLEFIAPPGL